MILERKLSAREIIGTIKNMSNRPEYYSGSEARVEYLDDVRLEKIYKAIEREHGKEAAEQYAQMVADIPKLTATDFLLNLYKLDGHDWNWDKELLGNEKGIYAGDIGSAFGTVMSVLSRSDKEVNETAYIRRRFLERHKIKIPESDIQRQFFNPYLNN
ncbi:hypothetical protein J4477_01115 [Candidatus Pacearchaeota archaeon]|nr:hypothetical protein [Candidatus Pacearchaeota archaeon]